jgi:chromosome partitioning protein
MHMIASRLTPGLFLFADNSGGPAPTWTNKEVLMAVGSTAAALVPVCLFVIKLVVSAYRRALRQAKREIENLRLRVQALEEAGGPDVLVALNAQLEKAQKDADRLTGELAAAQGREVGTRKLAEQLRGEVVEARNTLKQYEGDLTAERRRVQRALSKGGQTWTEKVLARAPEFKPLEPDGRRMVIVSVLNLKGGVGKTTITGNLGAALDGLGCRTLMLDLDLQGSLTGLFLTEADQERLYNEQRLLGDFLAASFGAEHPNLLDYIQPVLPSQQSGLVPTTDALAYAEMNLTIRWLLREGNKDPRFLLRRELHFRRVTNAYDIVLLDCPPLINVCCVNALAASDYLLIPILPSKQATARVPILLRRLQEFRQNINPALKAMGVLSNRTHRSELTADEESRLSLLSGQCKDVWGEDVPQFETFIRQSTEIRTAEDWNRPLRPQDVTYQAFVDLAREFVGRLPTFCQPQGLAGARAEEVTR